MKPAPKLRGHRRGAPMTINPQRYAPKVEPRESWWLNQPREKFTEHCANQPFRWVPGVLLKSWTHDE